jgi:spermidine synthase
MPKSIPLFFSVFVCGAVVMVFELAGSRIMAPYFGTSIYVWTGLIGVIMGSLALGYWLGGKLADKRADHETYSLIIFISGLAVFWAFLAKDLVPAFFTDLRLPIEAASLFVSIIVFFPASACLGLVSPYAVRLKIVGIDTSASTVGNLYAASTLGSIVGTFSAGYLLIPFIGTASILFVLTATLLVLSFAFSKRHFGLKIIALIAVAAAFFLVAKSVSIVNQIDGRVSLETEYNSVKIFLGKDTATGKPVRYLSFDPFARQGAMFMDSDELVWDYTKFYRLADHFNPRLKKTLMIGGGAYSYPKDFLAKHKDATMDVVEIDPGITAAAKKYFSLADDPRLKVFDEDARSYINATPEKYDAIYDDAFTSSLTAPFQLTSVEAIRKQYELLNDGGVVLANIGASLAGPNSRFLRAEVATFRVAFPQVYVFAVKDPSDAYMLQNVMIVALKSSKMPSSTSSKRELNDYLEHCLATPLTADVPILTDDHAPIEYYMKGIL